MSELDRSLFDVEDVETMPRVRDMTVSPVGTADVQEFSRRYHYTGTGGSDAWRWGLWHDFVLLGVVAYNLPTRRTCESVFGPEHFDKVWHMGRLALAESAPHNSESRLIGGSLRAIQIARPDVWAVLTYAAMSAGHVGYVYQATNALYTGTGGSSHFLVDEHGHRRANTGPMQDAQRIAARGWRRMEDQPKHRYVYVLGSKTQRRHRMAQLRLPVLPYPKALPVESGAA